jgi:hypothetical protein
MTEVPISTTANITRRQGYPPAPKRELQRLI